jgi:hypothetical protein
VILTLQPVRVETGGPDEEGRLVLADDKLVAVLVRLSEAQDDANLAGQWFLEAGFGGVDGPTHPTFGDLEAAQDWIRQRLAPKQAAGKAE